MKAPVKVYQGRKVTKLEELPAKSGEEKPERKSNKKRNAEESPEKG